MSLVAGVPGVVGAAFEIAVVDLRSVGWRATRGRARGPRGRRRRLRLVERRDRRAPGTSILRTPPARCASSRAGLRRLPGHGPRRRAADARRCFPSMRPRLPSVTLLAAAVVVHSAWAADARSPRGTAATARGAASSAPRDRPFASGPSPDGRSAAATTASPSSRVRSAGQARHRSACRGRGTARLADRARRSRCGSAARAPRERGAIVLAEPDDLDYGRAIVAADFVLLPRSGSVGETNGPLLDALGAGRVIGTRDRLDPEVAASAATSRDRRSRSAAPRGSCDRRDVASRRPRRALTGGHPRHPLLELFHEAWNERSSPERRHLHARPPSRSRAVPRGGRSAR